MNWTTTIVLAVALPAMVLSACGTKRTNDSQTVPVKQNTSLANPQPAHSTTGIDEQTNTDSSDSDVIALEEIRIQVVLDEEGREQTIVSDARTYLDLGNEALADGDYKTALASYKRLIREFSQSALVGPALYNAGLAYEGLEQIDAAVDQYRILAKIDPSSRNGVDAQVRIAALFAEYQRWPESLTALDELLKLPKLEFADRLEAYARRGYVLLESKDYVAAELALQEAIAFAKLNLSEAELQGGYYIGMATFYLGDVARRQFDEIPIRLPEDQMGRDIEAKAKLVNLASDRFGNTVETGNVYWATAAGFRLADIQHQFWRALIAAPVPPHLSSEVAKIYVVEVHKQSLGFLQKALDIHGKNVKLATIYKGPTNWSRASEKEVMRLIQLIGREQAGELTLGEDTQPEGLLGNSGGEYIPRRVEL